MKAWVLSLLVLLVLDGAAQDAEPLDHEQQLESRLEAGAVSPEDDDASTVRMLALRRRPLNLNSVVAEDLEQLDIVSNWQIDQLLRYRQQFGPFVSIYELQAVPGWDLMTIYKMLPLLTLSPGEAIGQTLKGAWKSGHGMLTLSMGRLLEKPAGYAIPDSAGAEHFFGTRDQLSLRYRFSYANRLQFGLLARKDAGEQIFGKSQPAGFDFYGFYFSLRGKGLIKNLVLGDFTINFGQGLTLWQSLAFGGSSVVAGIQRLAPPVQAHSSAGEYNFQRGVALGLQRRNWEGILFCSYRKISANLVSDSVNGQQTVSALQSGGYHRTASEMADRNNLGQFSSGAGMKYRLQGGYVGINAVYWKFSVPFKKSDEAYKLFAFEGRSLYNVSIDYSYSWKNMHAFGELAIDPQWHKALVGGMLISLEPRADLSLLYRNISSAYQSMNASAFTTNSTPANEKGFYAGLILRPTGNFELSGYCDFSVFPWLKYRVNMPSNGYEYWLQVVYTASKQTKLYARFRSTSSPMNQSAEPVVLVPVGQVHKKELQLHTEISFSRALILRQRVAMLWFYGADGEKGEGFLAYEECFYHPVSRIGMTFNFRLQYFETGGYDERLFVYESDLPYHFSIPFFYGRGWHYYVNAGGKMRLPWRKAKAGGKVAWHIKWAQTIYPGVSGIGDGPDRTEGNHRSEISLQLSIPIL